MAMNAPAWRIYSHALQTTSICKFNLGTAFCAACVGARCSSAVMPSPNKTNWYAFLHGVRAVCRRPYQKIDMLFYMVRAPSVVDLTKTTMHHVQGCNQLIFSRVGQSEDKINLYYFLGRQNGCNLLLYPMYPQTKFVFENFEEGASSGCTPPCCGPGHVQ